MQTATLLKHWCEVRRALLCALDQLTGDQLAFTPCGELRSLGQTACHIAGAEEGWFRFCVTREIDGWEAANYQLKDFPTVADLKRLLSDVHARTDAMFPADPLSAEAVMQRRVILPWGAETSVEEVVWHVLEHEIHHRGEIFLELGLIGIEAPDV
jgi:uncharacterized damage-inducible protein DinB